MWALNWIDRYNTLFDLQAMFFFFSFFKLSENVQQKNSIMFRIIITSNRMFDLIIVFDVLVFLVMARTIRLVDG